MIRLLMTLIIIFLMYVGFQTVTMYDSTIKIENSDFIIQINGFILVGVYLISTIILFLLLKIIFFLFNIPSLIKVKIKNIQTINENYNLLLSAFLLITGEKDKVLKIRNKITTFSTDNKDFYYLLMAETEKEFDIKINYYRQLLGSKKFAFFAYKRMAQIYFNEKLYTPSLEYAIAAYNIKEDDKEILEILLHSYAKEQSWDKFQFALSKYRKIAQINKEQSIQISEYYLIAAKNYLELGDESIALNNIEEALLYNPTSVTLLELYCSLKVNREDSLHLLKLLLNSFKINPSFEIVELYSRFSNEPPLQQLAIFKESINYNKDKGLLLAIETFYNQTDKFILEGHSEILS